jgi:hypothetical protein
MQFGFEFIQQYGHAPLPSQGIRVPSREHQDQLNRGEKKSLPHGRAGSHSRTAVWIGFTDVCQPSCAQCRTKLITQVIHGYWNASDISLILPNMICNTKAGTNL